MISKFTTYFLIATVYFCFFQKTQACQPPEDLTQHVDKNLTLAKMVTQYHSLQKDKMQTRKVSLNSNEYKIDQEHFEFGECKQRQLEASNGNRDVYLNSIPFCYLLDVYVPPNLTFRGKIEYDVGVFGGAELIVAPDLDTTLRLFREGGPLTTCQVPGQNTALQNAVIADNESVERVSILLKSGAHRVINRKGVFGMTALHFATVLGREEIVKMLLDAGADVSIVVSHNGKQLTARDIAVAEGYDRIVRLIDIQILKDNF